MPGSFTSLLLPGTGIINLCRVPASYSEKNNSEKMWQTEVSSRVVWLCLCLPLVTSGSRLRGPDLGQQRASLRLAVLWSSLLPSPACHLCFQLHPPFNLFANKTSIVKRCGKSNYSNKMASHSSSAYSPSSLSSPRKVAARRAHLSPTRASSVCTLNSASRLPPDSLPSLQPGSFPEAWLYHRTSEGGWLLLTSG